MHGKGQLEWQTSGKDHELVITCRQIGEMMDGKITGLGYKNYFDHKHIESEKGSYVDGKKEGFCIEQAKNGSSFEGQFKGNLRDGAGCLREAEGQYEGTWYGGTKNG